MKDRSRGRGACKEQWLVVRRSQEGEEGALEGAGGRTVYGLAVSQELEESRVTKAKPFRGTGTVRGL